MVRCETDTIRRQQAAQEAVEVLRESGFIVSNFDISVEPSSQHFELQTELAVGEMTRPLEALKDDSDKGAEDEDDGLNLGAGFALGFTAGLIAANSADCDCDGE